jgi:hypothetical protein
MPTNVPLTHHVASAKSHPSDPVTFKEVFREELTQIAESRRKREVDTPAPTADSLIGLAFSGGGIRSATFNLGILQALAETGLLHKFDYLSTVSGGGYIGSWLAAVTHRFLSVLPDKSFRDVEKALVPVKREPDGREERTFLHWLRLYSNYLTPHTGAFSGDTWAMIGTWLRNVFLNQTVLGLLFIGVFVCCDGVLLWLMKSSRLYPGGLLIGGAVAWFIAAFCMAWNVSKQVPSRHVGQTWFQRVQVRLTVIFPFVLGCLLLNSAVWRWREAELAPPFWQWVVFPGAYYFLAWAVAGVSIRLWREQRQKKSPEDRMLSLTAFLLSSLVAGAVGGCLGWEYCRLLSRVPRSFGANWTVGVFGTGAIMLIMLLAGALHLGFAGRGCRDLVREWWARLGGYLMLSALGWLLLAGSCIFGPLLVRWLLAEWKWKSIFAVVLWIAHNYLGLQAAKSPHTSGKNEKVKPADGADATWVTRLLKNPKVLDRLARFAPYVFALGMILFLTTAVHIVAGLAFRPELTHELWGSIYAGPAANTWHVLSVQYWRIQWNESYWWLLGAGVILWAASFELSRRVDVNDFSLHHFYRNRLVRCYLGASNPERKPQPFTGFDPNDDIALKDFAGNYPGPYPILNAALNITSGAELGYGTRRAKSFVFTPLYCGYDFIFPGQGAARFQLENASAPTYSKTELGRTAKKRTRITSKRGIALGTAVAISGAAASPNMGYYTSPATALFMTLFDVRLGWWMGNPRFPKYWKSPGPTSGLGYLLSELVAQSDQNKHYVYLSDGGHFENLGVYELIKRHCKVIVACDADCDGSYVFDNLLALIEKARADFGARIAIDFSKIRPKDGSRESERNFAIGDIFYDPQNPDDRGRLFYIKTSLPSKPDENTLKEDSLPDDVRRYADENKPFPHQTTADQWFDELQFESYRALGQYIGRIAAVELGAAIEAALGEDQGRELVRSAS